jgi:hypothetical protein
MRKGGVAQRVTRLVQHLILLQHHSFEVRLQGREVVRLQRGEKPACSMVLDSGSCFDE